METVEIGRKEMFKKELTVSLIYLKSAKLVTVNNASYIDQSNTQTNITRNISYIDQYNS